MEELLKEDVISRMQEEVDGEIEVNDPVNDEQVKILHLATGNVCRLVKKSCTLWLKDERIIKVVNVF